MTPVYRLSALEEFNALYDQAQMAGQILAQMRCDRDEFMEFVRELHEDDSQVRHTCYYYGVCYYKDVKVFDETRHDG